MAKYQSPYLHIVVLLCPPLSALTQHFMQAESSPWVLTFPVFTPELSFVATIIAVVVAVISSLSFKHYQGLHNSASQLDSSKPKPPSGFSGL